MEAFSLFRVWRCGKIKCVHLLALWVQMNRIVTLRCLALTQVMFRSDWPLQRWKWLMFRGGGDQRCIIALFLGVCTWAWGNSQGIHAHAELRWTTPILLWFDAPSLVCHTRLLRSLRNNIPQRRTHFGSSQRFWWLCDSCLFKKIVPKKFTFCNQKLACKKAKVGWIRYFPVHYFPAFLWF